ncbi:response regulator transcription factor [Bacillus massiliigorillae]|uniref:response regulator transcription factor n=1 Tax=Bacillus massiliigorillae TaxID=1243664 RepID=UPI0003A17E4B|nr:response regulator transcription factor [Bacillus massiliigorillae]
MFQASIVIVEDDVMMSEVLSLYLKKEGYDVKTFESAEKAWVHIQKHFPTLLLLDVNLPGQTGFELAKKYREVYLDGVLIFLSGNSAIEEKLTGFLVGGDDYITKPFDIEELLARIKVHLRKEQALQEAKPKDLMNIGSLQLDLRTKTVFKNQQEVLLFVKEKKLLFFLAKNYDQVFSADDLFEMIWGLDSEAELKTVAVHISNLRKKIELDPKRPEYLHTVRGFGYKFFYQAH